MAHPLEHFIPERYDTLLQQKVAKQREVFIPFTSIAPDVFPSAIEHFRQRAEFRIWHEGDTCHYSMFDPEMPKQAIRIDHFPIASKSICKLMPKLLEKINANSTLKHRLFQVEFLSTLSGEVLITLIYHKLLEGEWENAALQLQESLGAMILGRARKQKIILSRDWVNEALDINQQTFHYRQYENGFTQPNAQVNQVMISWACKQSVGKKKSDLLELYCGNGNFTLPLSQHYRKVLATEVSKTSIAAAKYNCSKNNINNIQFVRLSSEETTEALHRVRAFRRLAEIDLDSYCLDSVFVDPPRAGLDKQTLALVSEFKHILYISCNPATLAENLSVLQKTHEIKGFALFDQFPYTDHCECGVSLQRRAAS